MWCSHRTMYANKIPHLIFFVEQRPVGRLWAVISFIYPQCVTPDSESSFYNFSENIWGVPGCGIATLSGKQPKLNL